MAKKYTKDHIKVLSTIDAVRKRPAMYIGSTEEPLTLFNELIDNAIDEAMNGYASKIVVEKNKTKYVVTDNGRGIPVGDKTIGKETLPVPVLIATKPHSGGKFNSDAYTVSGGLHGMGLVVVNALSTEMKIEINVQKQGYYIKHVYVFKRGQLTSTDVNKNLGKRPWSTRVSFVPDKKIFHSLDVNLNYIKDKLKIVKSVLKKVQIILKINKEVTEIDATKELLFKQILLNTKADLLFDPISFSFKDDFKKLNVTFTIVNDLKRQHQGVVNLLVTPQGSHINAVINVIASCIYEYAKNKKVTIDKQDSTIGLRLWVDIFLPENILGFSGQVKEKLETHKKHFNNLLEEFRIEFSKWLTKNDSIAKEIIERIHNYRLKLKHSDTLKTKKKRGILNQDDALIDCKDRDGEIYIVEGASAANSIKNARNPYKHAILPLRGKSLNATAASLAKILKNKEFASLIRALGLGVSDNIDISKLNYKSIIIATDADIDGSHIVVLLLGFFLKVYPQLLKEGKVFIVNAPLYKLITKNNKHYPAWSIEEMKAVKTKFGTSIKEIKRYKGLGEMNPDEIKKYLLDPKIRKLTQVILDEDSNIRYLSDLLVNSTTRKTLVELANF